MQLYGAGFVVFAMVFVVTCEPFVLQPKQMPNI
jgi:hypothetical protein